jgi:hypothetical protein
MTLTDQALSNRHLLAPSERRRKRVVSIQDESGAFRQPLAGGRSA